MFVRSLNVHASTRNRAVVLADIFQTQSNEEAGFCVMWDNGDIQLAYVSETVAQKTCHLRFRPGRDPTFFGQLRVVTGGKSGKDIDVSALFGLFDQKEWTTAAVQPVGS